MGLRLYLLYSIGMDGCWMAKIDIWVILMLMSVFIHIDIAFLHVGVRITMKEQVIDKPRMIFLSLSLI